ncbi:MAG: TolC family protein [Desulfopila sp.]
MKMFSAVVACAVTSVFMVQAAFGLDLEEMQDIALSKRELVKRYQINMEKSIKDVALARAPNRPSVDLSYQANRLDEDSISEAEENSVLRSAVTWNIFNGFKDTYQIESAQLLRQVEQYRLNGIEQDIMLNVALRYLDAYQAKANLEVARKNLLTLKKIYRDAQNRLEVGLIDRNELLKFKVDLDNSDIQVERARADLQKSIELLGREIGRKVAIEQLDFAEFEAIPAKMEMRYNASRMFDNRSELLALGKLVDASRSQALAEESGFYPRVDLVGSYQNYDNDVINSAGDISEDELRAQLQLSINLYQGGATRESVAKARLESRGLQYDFQELRDSLQTELNNLHIDFKVSLRNVKVALGGIEQAEENLRITRLKYGEGLQRESDLLDAVANLSRAQFNHVAAVSTVFQNHFQIVRMVEEF